MLYREVITVCSEIHKSHIAVGKTYNFLTLNLVVHALKTGLYI